ncbi:MAG: hypothetical protein ABSF90_07815 [Syntrophobacteraceae bacterium]
MRRTNFLCTLALCSAVILFFGCSQNREKIENAKNRLELARTKNDLDQMYLILKELSVLQKNDEQTIEELRKVEIALPLLERIKVSKGDHNHEDVVSASYELLKIFPQHAEARRALKESGLIFSHLQESISLFNECITYDDEQQRASLIQTTSELGEKKADYSKIVNKLALASDNISNALKLDPYFDKAISLNEVVVAFRNTIGISIANSVYIKSDVIINKYLAIYDGVYHFMTIIININGSAAEAWATEEPYVNRNRQEDRTYIAELNELSSYLLSFKETDISQLATIATDINVNACTLVDAVTNPKGSMIDYKNNVSAFSTKAQELSSRFKSSCPNPEMINSSVHGFAESIKNYELFHKPEETKKILQQSKEIISS